MSDDGEPLAMATCARRFDASIEGEQICLECDFINDAEEVSAEVKQQMLAAVGL